MKNTDLEYKYRGFTKPKRFNPPYNRPFEYRRIPRKLKKKIKKLRYPNNMFCLDCIKLRKIKWYRTRMRITKVHYVFPSKDANTILWYYLGIVNREYRDFLIHEICKS